MMDSKQILDPSFITGFVDAEGSFMIQITESKMSKLDWAVIGSFQIRLHSKDLLILKEIQKFFGGIGKINILPKDQSITYLVRDMKSLTNVIIPHFDNYPLQSAKKIDYGLWKEYILLMANKEHLTQAGLEKIISIKGAINNGLPDKLINAFSHVKVLTRPEFIVSKEKLNPYWISGFTEGDGSFTFSTGTSLYACYEISLHKRDEPLLLKINEFFDSKGNVRSYGAMTSAKYNITAKSDLNSLIIPHFNRYSLFGVKLHNYLIWRNMVELITNKLHLTPEGKAKLIELKSTLNKI